MLSFTWQLDNSNWGQENFGNWKRGHGQEKVERSGVTVQVGADQSFFLGFSLTWNKGTSLCFISGCCKMLNVLTFVKPLFRLQHQVLSVLADGVSLNYWPYICRQLSKTDNIHFSNEPNCQWLISAGGTPIMRSVLDATDQSFRWLIQWLSDVTCTLMNMSPRRLTGSVAASCCRHPRVTHLIYCPDCSACPHHFLKAPEVSFPVLCLTWIWGNEAWESWIITHGDF